MRVPSALLLALGTATAFTVRPPTRPMSTHHHHALLPATMTLPSGKDKHGVWLRARRPTIVSSDDRLKNQTLEAAVDYALKLDT